MPIAFRVAAGTPTDPTTPDTEYSTDGGASFSDCAEEITTGGTNGAGYITLTGAEMNNNMLWLAAKSANALTTPVVLVPRVLATVGSGTLSAGSAGGGTLGTLLAYDVTGCFIRTTGGTGGGGTGGANNQARKIATYNTSTGEFTVTPNWETTPSTDTTYDVLLPENVTLGMLQAINPTTAGRKINADASGNVPATIADGSLTPAKFHTDYFPAIWNTLSIDITTGIGDFIRTTLTTISGYLDTEVAAILAAVDSEVAAIKAKTDNLPSDPADASVVDASFTSVLSAIAGISGLDAAGVRSAVGLASANLDTQLSAIAGYIDTEVAATLAAVDSEVAAIKAKTDNLPSDPADASVVDASFTSVLSAIAGITGLSASDIRAAVGLASANLDTQLGAIAGYIDTEVAAILAAVDSEVAAIKAKTDNLPSDPADQSAVEAAITAVWYTALTHSFRATGATGSPAQLLYEIMAGILMHGTTELTKTLQNLDGSDSTKTFEFDANPPTSITETH